MKSIRGLTLWRPWTWAITHAGKRVENRTWKPSGDALRVGDWLAIHAGLTYDAAAALWIREHFDMCVPSRAALPAQVIVAVARYDGAVRAAELDQRFGAARAAELRPWAGDAWCWVLSHVLVLPAPVPCRGTRALWDLPGDVRDAVRAGAVEALRAKRAAMATGESRTLPPSTSLEGQTTPAPVAGAGREVAA